MSDRERGHGPQWSDPQGGDPRGPREDEAPASAEQGAGPGAEAGTGAANEAGPEAGVNEQRRQLITWLWRLPVLLAVGGGAVGLYEAIRIHFEKDAPSAHPTFAPRPSTPVGSLGAFAQVWNAVPFELAGDHPIPAIVVRLPGPIPGGLEASGPGGETLYLAGFSRVCTHMGCTVYLNRDLPGINFAFNYQTTHPDLTCPCHLSIFDPTRAGEAVSGPAGRPLPRVQLELRGNDIVAVGLERT
ncbi:MAG: Rieske 2Fe-2S domain-containing protein [Deinococcales bacterium]